MVWCARQDCNVVEEERINSRGQTKRLFVMLVDVDELGPPAKKFDLVILIQSRVSLRNIRLLHISYCAVIWRNRFTILCELCALHKDFYLTAVNFVQQIKTICSNFTVFK